MSGESVLIVINERSRAAYIESILELEGYRTQAFASGENAVSVESATRPPDLVLLDIELPDLSGIEVCRRIRASKRCARLPVVFVTDKDEEIFRVVAFEVGADDYVVHPFSTREFLLRIQVLLRRAKEAGNMTSNQIHYGRLRIDTRSHSVWIDEGQVELTALEYRLLCKLLERRGRVQSRRALLGEVWNVSAQVNTRTVDTHIMRLRQKLGPVGECVETYRGVGYQLRDVVGEEELQS